MRRLSAAYKAFISCHHESGEPGSPTSAGFALVGVKFSPTRDLLFDFPAGPPILALATLPSRDSTRHHGGLCVCASHKRQLPAKALHQDLNQLGGQQYRERAHHQAYRNEPPP